VVVALRQLKDIKETRQAELYMRLWEKWNTKEFSDIRFDVWSMRNWMCLDDFIEQYHPVFGSHPEAKHLFASWRTFDRTIGGLAELRRKKLIEIDFLDSMMIHDIYNWWWTFGQLVYESIEKRSLLSEGENVPFIKEVVDYDRMRRPWMFDNDTGEPREPADSSIELPWVKPEDVIEIRKKVYQ
jgi:hypothetical protein